MKKSIFFILLAFILIYLNGCSYKNERTYDSDESKTTNNSSTDSPREMHETTQSFTTVKNDNPTFKKGQVADVCDSNGNVIYQIRIDNVSYVSDTDYLDMK